jgi:5-methylcytosine-specific restriction endonuclease McrA
MPIRPENKSRYPADWSDIRARILARAKHRCEKCGVPNYAVGYRERDGRFIPNAGNGPCDASGQGLSWPSLQPLTYAEAAEFVEVNNCCIGRDGRRCDDDGNRWIVIVLTTAHVNDADPGNCTDENLAAWCQRCHNRHDTAMRQRNSAVTRERKAAGGTMEMFATAGGGGAKPSQQLPLESPRSA